MKLNLDLLTTYKWSCPNIFHNCFRKFQAQKNNLLFSLNQYIFLLFSIQSGRGDSLAKSINQQYKTEAVPNQWWDDTPFLAFPKLWNSVEHTHQESVRWIENPTKKRTRLAPKVLRELGQNSKQMGWSMLPDMYFLN